MLNQMMQAFQREFIGKKSEDWQPAKDSIYYSCMTDEDIAAMRERNEAAIEKCIKKMGKKWVLHKSHKVTRI